MEINKQLVGKRIKSIRQSKGMTLEEFGKLFAASKGNVSLWESGSSLPSNERLKTIAKLGNVSVDDLLYGTKEEVAAEAINDALNEFLTTEDFYLSDYEEKRTRYHALLDNLYINYIEPENHSIDTFRDPYKIIYNRTMRELHEEFLKGDRTDEEMLEYLYTTILHAKNDIVQYYYDPLTEQAINNGDIKDIKMLLYVEKGLDNLLDDLKPS